MKEEKVKEGTPFDKEILIDFKRGDMSNIEITQKYFKGQSHLFERWRRGENSTGKCLFRNKNKTTSSSSFSYEIWLKELEKNARIYWDKNKDAPNDRIIRLLISKYGEKITADICSAWTLISHDKNLAEFLKREYK